MTRYEKAKKLKANDFKQLFGVAYETFEAMIEILTNARIERHQKGGRPPKLSVEDQLFMTLKYLRQYVTQKELAFEYEVGEATAHDTIVWVEDTLIKSCKFSLPGKKILLEENEIEVVLVDVTESPIERPKKNNETGIQVKRNAIP